MLPLQLRHILEWLTFSDLFCQKKRTLRLSNHILTIHLEIKKRYTPFFYTTCFKNKFRIVNIFHLIFLNCFQNKFFTPGSRQTRKRMKVKVQVFYLWYFLRFKIDFKNCFSIKSYIITILNVLWSASSKQWCFKKWIPCCIFKMWFDQRRIFCFVLTKQIWTGQTPPKYA